jgi:acetyl-CoA carboxylase biotin carboxylase subunit
MKKVLIANRGEIAVRVIRACHDLGLQTVAVYSKADSESLHVLHADESVCIGEAPSSESYLKVSNILSAAEITGADAVHPGFGFLSENANFASICESCGLTFIGPSSEAISQLGDKAQAKAIAKKSGCPVVPGNEGVVASIEEGLAVAESIGYPIFIKAVAGGGGKGIRIAHQEDEFCRLFTAARTEAQASFGNPDVYLEKMIQEPRHIEVQILADKHGNVIHLGERDCSIQRRRQKLIEEAPSPIVTPKLREKMGKAAVNLAKAAKYSSVGTVEFLLDKDQNFYFMEMNTRIQVEHTITEMITGVDLIVEQIQSAMGKELTIKQKDVTLKGHSIQCRINAEDPSNGFSPHPGKVEYYLPPGGPHVRVDSACYSGYRIPPYYDSMVAKMIVTGKDRKQAIDITKRALREFHFGGIKTTIPFHQYMFEQSPFLNSCYDLTYIDKLIDDGCKFQLNDTQD